MINHQNLCMLLNYQEAMLRVYQQALVELWTCPSEWISTCREEASSVREGIEYMLN